MKYEMPALTDGQREEAIKKCHAAIKSLAPIQGVAEQTSKICFEIALASLTAEPRLYVRKKALELVLQGKPAMSAAHPLSIDDDVFLYTEPLVPALNQIVLNSDEKDYPIDWYAGAKTRDMVIDVIRAAGYEVKDD